MPNPYFKFKHFTVYQDKCAMKVCTDACLFGAWVAAFIGQREQSLETLIGATEKNEQQALDDLELANNRKILDIGSGTGLLSLMLAQQIGGIVDTIEIDKDACLQAMGNVASSKWAKRINVIHADVTKFEFKSDYDLIVANPPFFENDLRTEQMASNIARHDETLSIATLLSIVSLHLSPSGSFAVLLPYRRLSYCLTIAGSNNLFPFIVVSVKQSTDHNFFRCMIIFKKRLTINVIEKELTIRNGNSYAPEFIALLKDYYLYL